MIDQTIRKKSKLEPCKEEEYRELLEQLKEEIQREYKEK